MLISKGKNFVEVESIRVTGLESSHPIFCLPFLIHFDKLNFNMSIFIL